MGGPTCTDDAASFGATVVRLGSAPRVRCVSLSTLPAADQHKGCAVGAPALALMPLRLGRCGVDRQCFLEFLAPAILDDVNADSRASPRSAIGGTARSTSHVSVRLVGRILEINFARDPSNATQREVGPKFERHFCVCAPRRIFAVAPACCRDLLQFGLWSARISCCNPSWPLA